MDPASDGKPEQLLRVLALTPVGRHELSAPQSGLSLPQRWLLGQLDGEASLADLAGRPGSPSAERFPRDAAKLVGLGLALDVGETGPTASTFGPSTLYGDITLSLPLDESGPVPSVPRPEPPSAAGVSRRRTPTLVAGAALVAVGVGAAVIGSRGLNLDGVTVAHVPASAPALARGAAAVATASDAGSTTSGVTPGVAQGVASQPLAGLAAAASAPPVVASTPTPLVPTPVPAVDTNTQAAAIRTAAADGLPRTAVIDLNAAGRGRPRTDLATSPAGAAPPGPASPPGPAPAAASPPVVLAAPSLLVPTPTPTPTPTPAPTFTTPTPASPPAAPPAAPVTAPVVALPSPPAIVAAAPSPVPAAAPAVAPSQAAPLRPLAVVEPAFPREGLGLGTQAVLLQARMTVAPNGTVTQVNFTQTGAGNRLFERAARAALLQWRFPEGAGERVVVQQIRFSEN